MAAASAFDNTEENDLPLFACVSNLKNVHAWERNKAVNRTRTGILGLEEQVNRNVQEKLRKTGEVGERFKDHGSEKVLQDALDESTEILKVVAKHEEVRQDRLEAAKNASWQRPWEIAQNNHLQRRRARQSEQIECQPIEMGKWSQVCSIAKGKSKSFKVALSTKDSDLSLPPTLVIHVRGETAADDPDVMVSRVEVPSLQAYQVNYTLPKRLIAALDHHPGDPISWWSAFFFFLGLLSL